MKARKLYPMIKREFYCNATSPVCMLNLITGIIFGVIAIASVSFLVSDTLMWRYGYIFGDYDTATMILISLFGGSTYASIVTIIGYFRIVRKPMVALYDTGISIKNVNTGNILHFSFSDIDRIELSEVKFFGKSWRCVNIIPATNAYEKIVAQCRKRDRVLVERLYRSYGAVGQVFDHLLEEGVDHAYSAMNEALRAFNDRNN